MVKIYLQISDHGKMLIRCFVIVRKQKNKSNLKKDIYCENVSFSLKFQGDFLVESFKKIDFSLFALKCFIYYNHKIIVL